ncbi:MAG: SIR2 family NAD-dependent protein deacylase [Oscillospiraceae bacterium]
MSLRNATTPSTAGYSELIDRLKKEIAEADAIVVGAGSGLSTSAGLTYAGPRFQENFADFIDKYHYTNMYSAGFQPYSSPEEYWAYWSRHIWLNRYAEEPGAPYSDLLDIVADRNYFVLTTNVDHCFQRTGFDKRRLFYTQGDYGLFQCSKPCHKNTYDNEELVRRMVEEQSGMRIPSELLPICPKCGRPMTNNLRSDNRFVEDEGWHAARGRYEDFIRRQDNRHALFLELGVGGNTPVIIKYPFWRMTQRNPKAVYVCVNKGEAVTPQEIKQQSICLDADIGQVLHDSKA